MKRKPLYKLSGTAKDQETIIRLRSWYDDEVKKIIGGDFKSSNMTWEMNDSKQFNFTIKYW